MLGALELIAALRLPAVRGIIQVGASSGQEVAYFRDHGVQFAALIEPLPQPYGELVSACSGLPGYLPVNALCGTSDEEWVEFHVATNEGQSSSILKPAQHLLDYPWVQFPQTVRMQTTTLDRVFQAVKTHRPEIADAADLLFMDVQGAELHVVKGGNSVLNKVQYIYTEVGIGGGYENAVELIDLQLHLRAYGFKLFELEMNAQGWGNAFFIKKS